MKNKVIFGSSGNDEEFYVDHKFSKQAPLYLREHNCFAYEYGFSRGIHPNQFESNKIIGNCCREEGITLSIHAPYFINFANPDDMKVENSINYLLQSYRYGAIEMGAERIIFHPASLGSMSREKAFEVTKQNLIEFAKRFNRYEDSVGKVKVYFCIETMGKHGQLGTLDEVINLCSIDPIFMPCIDFGHINSFEGGSLKSTEDFVRVIDKVKNAFNDERKDHLHIHFSKIKYGAKGELAHLKFSDEGEPDYRNLIDALIQTGVNATVICESAGSQMSDSFTMKKYYDEKIRSDDD